MTGLVLTASRRWSVGVYAEIRRIGVGHCRQVPGSPAYGEVTPGEAEPERGQPHRRDDAHPVGAHAADQRPDRQRARRRGPVIAATRPSKLAENTRWLIVWTSTALAPAATHASANSPTVSPTDGA